ncbi:hypothetical protein CWR43_13345 [Rhizobium sullae]|uniref:Uncharacterized protein n=1 Tax=Rhizobium sullae TaxID=50338 RepID=A0A2N0DAC3_RHISU|nr:hypothetical protein [Rhizobium sullae]PKA43048.1 hypothetical protein CWR43_13345 [Rhizobium sullae]
MGMIHRRDKRSTGLVSAFMACVAVLLYSFSAIGSHALALHGAATVLAADNHAHADGGHSHDDFDVLEGDADVSDHHHADHTHEKAGLLSLTGSSIRSAVTMSYSFRPASASAGPPYGIERPPRP